MNYHGIELDNEPDDLWEIQELIHKHQPARIVELGIGKGGMCCWLRDCMAGERIHPFVIAIANAPRPQGMTEYPDVAWIEGPPDIASLNRIKPILGAPTMLVVNGVLNSDQFDMWLKIIGVGQCLVAIGNSLDVAAEAWPCDFKHLPASGTMNIFERMPQNEQI